MSITIPTPYSTDNWSLSQQIRTDSTSFSWTEDTNWVSEDGVLKYNNIPVIVGLNNGASYVVVATCSYNEVTYKYRKSTTVPTGYGRYSISTDRSGNVYFYDFGNFIIISDKSSLDDLKNKTNEGSVICIDKVTKEVSCVYARTAASDTNPSINVGPYFYKLDSNNEITGGYNIFNQVTNAYSNILHKNSSTKLTYIPFKSMNDNTNSSSFYIVRDYPESSVGDVVNLENGKKFFLIPGGTFTIPSGSVNNVSNTDVIGNHCVAIDITNYI